ncbi:MAG: response regulator transcription factor [Acidobacteria bacterium]|nr:response regulator transcription factor [Acidobacteriota bacterium]
MRILLVEDELKVASFIRSALEEHSYAVDVSHDGEEGCYLAESTDYDLIILDIMLPKMDGFQLLRRLRARKPGLPVLVLTARGTVEDRVRGLDLGADDYLVKPFALAELTARVRALMRRGVREGSTELRVDDLVLDSARRRVTRAGKPIELSNKEYSLLEYLMRNANHAVTRGMIAEHVWDSSFDSFTNVIDVYINHLRNKVDRNFGRRLIHSVRGVGYRISATESEHDQVS